MVEEGRIVKMEVDYSATVDEKLPECERLAKSGKLNDALEILMQMEKQTRLASDMISTGRVLVTIVRLCFESNDWDLLNENIILLTKRRSQLKQAVAKMVQEAYTFVEKAPDKPKMLKLIETLRTVTAGKIYVEIERARLSKKLAEMKEQEGDIAEAANVLQELQVETYGSMEKTEKVDFILEQMRLCLAKQDYVRTQIISKKINAKFFEDESTHDQKLKYYRLMVNLDIHEKSYLSVCRHYYAIYDTPKVKNDPEKLKETLKCIVLYIILSPFSNEQQDFLHRVAADKGMEHIPLFKDLLEHFITKEIIRWNEICTKYEAELKQGSATNLVTEVFQGEEGKQRWQDLKNRVVEHNILVIASYYTLIRMERVAQLLDLNLDDAEEALSKLVVSKAVTAKIDRLEGVVSFSLAKDPHEVLNDWVTSLNHLMELVGKTTHLINKEEMVNAAKA